jgi:DNA-directed RNA polymerase alpha subunit
MNEEKNWYEVNINRIIENGRIINALRAYDVYSVGELLEQTEYELMRMHNFSHRSFAKLKEALAAHNLEIASVKKKVREVQWNTLSDEEILDMTSQVGLIRYFEAKLKEKNT